MAGLPSLGRRGLMSPAVTGEPRAWLIGKLRLLSKSRRLRRTAAISNLAVMVCLGASLAPQGLAQRTAFEQQGLAMAMGPPAEVVPWLVLLLAMSSAAASLMLLMAERERSLPVMPGQASPQQAARDGDISGAMERIGHDLRTPLTAIIGFSDMMQCEMHGPLGSDRYHSYAGHIRDSGVTLLQAIETAMAAPERLRSGELSPEPVRIPLAATVGRADRAVNEMSR